MPLYSLETSCGTNARQISVSMQIPSCLLMWAALSAPSVSERGAEEQTPTTDADPHRAAWKATSISAQTSAVTQIRQPQCSGLLSPPTGGGQPDLRRMETFSPRNGQNQLLPSSINATPFALCSENPAVIEVLRGVGRWLDWGAGRWYLARCLRLRTAGAGREEYDSPGCFSYRHTWLNQTHWSIMGRESTCPFKWTLIISESVKLTVWNWLNFLPTCLHFIVFAPVLNFDNNIKIII